MIDGSFGEFVKQLRMDKGVTLRTFCTELELDHGNFSRMERGLLAPPLNEKKFEAFAASLGIKKGSADWVKFHDLASLTRSRIPKDLMNDPAIVAKLPAVFRWLRKLNATPGKLDEFFDALERS